MLLPWLLFVSLTVVGGLMYNVSAKLATANMSPFVFTLALGLTVFVAQSVSFLVAKYAFKVDVLSGLTANGIVFAVVAGLGAALVDICYFLALRYGTPTASLAFWSIGSLIALTIFSILVFKEVMTLSKACGILLGIVSLYLISRQQG